MPVFEYKCNECNTKYEVLHKSSLKEDGIVCPECNSTNSKKLFSSFSASVGESSVSGDSCASGNCSVPSYSGCSTGMCGLN